MSGWQRKRWEGITGRGSGGKVEGEGAAGLCVGMIVGGGRRKGALVFNCIQRHKATRDSCLRL